MIINQIDITISDITEYEAYLVALDILLDKEECEINVLTIGSTSSCNLDNIKNELSLNLKSINQDDNPANEDETSSQYDEDNLNKN